MRSSENVSWFADIALKDRPAVGGKGGSLGELTRAGVGVPPGFVVRTGAFECFLGALEREEPVRSSVEALADQELGCALFAAFEDEETMTHALEHRDVIRRFGRFPHRNDALGRPCTPDELDYLKNANRYGQ